MEASSRGYRSPASWQELRDYVMEHRVVWVQTEMGALVCAASVTETEITVTVPSAARVPSRYDATEIGRLLLPR